MFVAVILLFTKDTRNEWKRCENTLEASEKDVKIHSKRVGKMIPKPRVSQGKRTVMEPLFGPPKMYKLGAEQGGKCTYFRSSPIRL